MYLTHEDYLYMGGAIEDAALFERYAARADALLNRMTHGRIASETPVRSCVQYAVLAMVDAMYADAQNGAEGREIASMTNDGVSVTYATGTGSGAAQAVRRYAGIARQYLEWETDANGTPLLYAGVDA